MLLGRKRLEEMEKKVALKLSIKKEYVDELKKRKINISELVNNYIKDYLKK